MTNAELRQNYQKYVDWFESKKNQGKSGIDELKASGLCEVIDGQYFPEMWSFSWWALKTAPIKPLKEAAERNIADNKAYFAEEAKYVSHAGQRDLFNSEYAKRFKEGQEENERRKLADVNYQAEVSQYDTAIREHGLSDPFEIVLEEEKKSPSTLKKFISSMKHYFNQDVGSAELGMRANDWMEKKGKK